MKNISILFCAFLLATTTLVGCDNFSDDDKNEPTTCYFGGGSTCKRYQPSPKRRLKDRLFGKGLETRVHTRNERKWHHWAKKLLQWAHRNQSYRLYFTEGSVTSFTHSDALNEYVKITKDYIYDEATNTIQLINSKEPNNRILECDGTNLSIIQFLGYKNDGTGKRKQKPTAFLNTERWQLKNWKKCKKLYRPLQ